MLATIKGCQQKVEHLGQSWDISVLLKIPLDFAPLLVPVIPNSEPGFPPWTPPRGDPSSEPGIRGMSRGSRRGTMIPFWNGTGRGTRIPSWLWLAARRPHYFVPSYSSWRGSFPPHTPHSCTPRCCNWLRNSGEILVPFQEGILILLLVPNSWLWLANSLGREQGPSPGGVRGRVRENSWRPVTFDVELSYTKTVLLLLINASILRTMLKTGWRIIAKAGYSLLQTRSCLFLE